MDNPGRVPIYPRSRMNEEQHLKLTIREIFAIRYIYRQIAQEHDELRHILHLNGSDLQALESANRKLTACLPLVRGNKP
jgi:hypothetical protein